MTSICFIRHGETEANRLNRFAGKTDLELNENGVRQAQSVGEKLCGERFDAVYCGNTKRVRQTFEIIRPTIIFPSDKLFFTDDIREVDFGEWENLTAAEIESRYAEGWQAYMDGWAEYTFPGGGGNREYFAQCGNFIRQIAEDNAGQKIAVFAHKGFILACVCALRNLPIERLFDSDIPNGSIFLMNLPE
jgi:broad specificity phosphatase PhoE